MSALLKRLGVDLPIIQAPMAGTSTPAMAAAVSNAGGLGSIGVGAVNADGARRMIETLQGLTNKPFNVNVFVHRPARADPERERAWLEALAPVYRRFGAEPPAAIGEIYTSFAEDQAMTELLLEENRVKLLSFPAARRHHHAYAAGYLEHVLSVTRTAVYLADKYAESGLTPLEY